MGVCQVCKLCKKEVIDIIRHHGINHEDLGKGLANLKAFGDTLKENTLLHTHIGDAECFGLLEIVGFVKRED